MLKYMKTKIWKEQKKMYKIPSYLIINPKMWDENLIHTCPLNAMILHFSLFTWILRNRTHQLHLSFIIPITFSCTFFVYFKPKSYELQL